MNTKNIPAPVQGYQGRRAAPAVTLHHGRPATTSREVASFFGKRHDDVLKSIRNLRANCPEEFHARNFAEMSETVKIGNGAFRQDVVFILYRDGFMLLTMGFTGKEALAWKIRFIEAFNAMEAQIAGALALPGKKEIVSPYVFRGVPLRADYVDGQAWFVARDVFAALGLAWASSSFKTQYGIRDEWVSIRVHVSEMNGTMLTWICLPAVVMLSLRGRKERIPRSIVFLRWIVETVLPDVKPSQEELAASARQLAVVMGNFARSIQTVGQE